MPVTRAAIYCRISRDHQRGALGVERQLEDCRAMTARLGWQVVYEYIDNDISAYSGKPRPAYRQMLADIEAGAIDAIIAWDTSRLYRRLKDLIELIDVFNEAGLTTIETVRAGTIDLSTPAGRTSAVILARIDQQASEDASERLRRQRLQAAAQGLPHAGSTRHFGFQKWVKRDGKVVPGNTVPMRRVLREQELVREAIARILAGDSVRGIVSDWNQRGITTAEDKPWSHFGFRRMITSPAIAGYRRHQGQLARHDDGTPVEGKWAPIVDRDDWQAIRTILADPARRTTRGRGPAYLLTGLIFCGVCGKRMRATVLGRDSQRLYRCEHHGPHAPSGRPARRVALVDDEVKDRVFHRIARSEQFKDVASRPDDDPTKPIYAELARLQAKYDRVGDSEIDRLAEDEELDEATRKALLKAAERKRVKIEQEMDGLRARLDALDGGRVRAQVPPNLPDIWDDLTLDRQRAIVQSMIEFVIVLPAERHGAVFHPDSIVTIWRGWTHWPDGVPVIDPVRARLEGSRGDS
jgi:site-specific DNA recombinase